MVDSLEQLTQNSQPDSVRIKAYFRLAWIHFTNDSEKAKSYTQGAREIGTVLSDSGTIIKCTYYDGLNHRLQGNYSEALENLHEALAFYERRGNEMQTTGALFNIAVVYSHLGEYDESLKYYYRELDINERHDNPGGVANSLNSIAIIHRKLEELDEAYEKYERALEIFTELDRQWDKANVISNMGNIHFDRGEYAEARVRYERALAIDREINDDWGVAYNLNTLADVMIRTGKADSAVIVLDEVLAIREKLGQQRELGETHSSLGAAFAAAENWPKAIFHFDKSLEIAVEIDAKELQSQAHLQLADVYKNTGDFYRAHLHREAYANLRDEILNEEKLRVLEELETKYETAKTEKELVENQLALEKSENENERRATFIYALSAGALLLIILLLLLYRSMLHKRRLNEQKMAVLRKEQELAGVKAMMLGEEKERSRIAKDLHDGLSGLLAGIKLKFESLRKSEPDVEFDEAIGSLDQASDEVRRISHNMMPKILESFGLIAALDDFFSNIRASKTLHVEFQHFGMEEKLEATTELVLYRIVQELMNNILRHSEATEALVQINRRDDILNVTVEDNGRGFDWSDARSKKGLGMSNLENRVAFLKGDLNVESSRDRGTSVFIELVLDKS